MNSEMFISGSNWL